ncbi:CPBP family intramembrane glutamic endopeptidase [Actinomycetospora sp. TBRC 11914]|uniref:CPBP family intramembrane glutamic endopeptidase n=1 Tax=Actinomycetospora sp. TBRC 11914 TaxID=2729387 RepID=UPI00145F6D20|nr:CPBP family intramembrane glutamic endopeptidase [Actinomycetospora sp. TBRC 11914]NMO90118.1 CPBP family intramembrane metalloprotease [Actinomycetospora sp. TBRC 11914]
MSLLRTWLAPPRPAVAEADGRERRLLVTEILVVATVTLGLSGLRSLISLLDSLAAPAPLASRQVAIDRPLATDAWVDLAAQLASSLQLVAWGGLGLYLLLRAGSGPRAVGLDGTRPGRDALAAVGLAALIGIPGLGFYLLTRALGINLTVVPSVLDDHWWRVPVLVLSAVANAWAEEVLVVGWLLTVLRRLGLSENRSLAISALLRGSYHLYQGFGGGLGNVVMGLVFGRYWQRSGRLWPLVGAHALIDVVAFVGSALLAGKVPFLPR